MADTPGMTSTPGEFADIDAIHGTPTKANIKSAYGGGVINRKPEGDMLNHYGVWIDPMAPNNIKYWVEKPAGSSVRGDKTNPTFNTGSERVSYEGDAGGFAKQGTNYGGFKATINLEAKFGSTPDIVGVVHTFEGTDGLDLSGWKVFLKNFGEGSGEIRTTTTSTTPYNPDLFPGRDPDFTTGDTPKGTRNPANAWDYVTYGSDEIMAPNGITGWFNLTFNDDDGAVGVFDAE